MTANGHRSLTVLSSDGRTTYTLNVVSVGAAIIATCTCPGWTYRARCRHATAHVAALTAARAWCEATRYPEQHRDTCEWCAHLTAINTDAGTVRAAIELIDSIGA